MVPLTTVTSSNPSTSTFTSTGLARSRANSGVVRVTPVHQRVDPDRTAQIGALDTRIESIQAKLQRHYDKKLAQPSRAERTKIVNQDLMSTFGISLDPSK